MEPSRLRKYASLQKMIKQLEEERDELKAVIIEDFHREGETKVERSYGSFTLATRTNYTYSEKVKKLESAVKIQKITEEEKGIAVPSTTEFIQFKELKIK